MTVIRDDQECGGPDPKYGMTDHLSAIRFSFRWRYREPGTCLPGALRV